MGDTLEDQWGACLKQAEMVDPAATCLSVLEKRTPFHIIDMQALNIRSISDNVLRMSRTNDPVSAMRAAPYRVELLVNELSDAIAQLTEYRDDLHKLSEQGKRSVAKR